MGKYLLWIDRPDNPNDDDEDSLFPYRDIPDLTAIVSQQGRGTPGRGFFAGHSELTNKGKVELKIFASRAQEDVFRWPHWTEFAAFLGITPMSALAPPRDELSDFKKISSVSSGKSLEHQLMQDRILADPHCVGIDLKGEILTTESQCEYLFWSLDRLDVIIKTTEEWIGFEVKPLSAFPQELRKGVYQAVKYNAIMRADMRDHGVIKPRRCILVIQGLFTADLKQLANRLKVKVVEGFCAD